VKVTPSFMASGGEYIYTYLLTNTSSVEIVGFVVTLPSAVPISACTELEHPVGWQLTTLPAFNQFDWFNDGNLLPGQSATFKFSTKFGPSADLSTTASCQDALGFSGKCYGPIPEPASILAMLTGIGGLVGLRRRRIA